MEIDLLNKTILVTGGTRGIGAAIVQLFQKCNADVIATGTDNKEIDRLNQESPGRKINYMQLDFTSNKSVQSFLDNLVERERIDVLINNAGVNRIVSINDIDENDWDWINNVNLRGPFLLTRAIVDRMKKQGYGRIINIASVFGVVSKAKRAAYSTTKWGLIGFTKAVALDLAPHNILVNAVSPGFVNTELTRKILGDKGIKEITSSIPQQRLAEVEEIAKTVVFLASDHNTYITGQNIIVDGGFTSA
jgi:3-oxoacyl-[acyl-carrier protein] reductase|tara:strand:+ start:234 stop:977 length:744 start_codon:yes stop_codon:yes gene_type:complete